MMFKEKLFFLYLLLIANSKFYLVKVDGDKEGEAGQFKTSQTLPLLVTDEDGASFSNDAESGAHGKVDKGAEYGNDYNDYGSMFVGGKDFISDLCLSFHYRLIQTKNKKVKNLQQAQERMEMWHPWNT